MFGTIINAEDSAIIIHPNFVVTGSEFQEIKQQIDKIVLFSISSCKIMLTNTEAI